jgi:hypothetical protein
MDIVHVGPLLSGAMLNEYRTICTVAFGQNIPTASLSRDVSSFWWRVTVCQNIVLTIGERSGTFNELGFGDRNQPRRVPTSHHV